MSVIRIKKARVKPYVTIETTALNDARLSFRAKGLHTYLMAKPDDEITLQQLERQSPEEGRFAIRTAMRELETTGYVRLRKIRDYGGQLSGWDIIISDIPHLPADVPPEEDTFTAQLNRLMAMVPDGYPLSGYIYLLQANMYVKIGKSHIPSARLRQLSIQLPFPFELIHLIGCENMMETDRLLKQKYAQKRIHGEWFALDQQDICRLQAITYHPSSAAFN